MPFIVRTKVWAGMILVEELRLEKVTEFYRAL